MGLVTLVKFKLSAAVSRAAFDPATLASALRHRALALVQFFLRHGAAVLQALHAGQFDAAQIQRRVVALKVGCRAIVLGLIGPRIDDE